MSDAEKVRILRSALSAILASVEKPEEGLEGVLENILWIVEDALKKVSSEKLQH